MRQNLFGFFKNIRACPSCNTEIGKCISNVCASVYIMRYIKPEGGGFSKRPNLRGRLLELFALMRTNKPCQVYLIWAREEGIHHELDSNQSLTNRHVYLHMKRSYLKRDKRQAQNRVCTTNAKFELFVNMYIYIYIYIYIHIYIYP